MLRDSCYYLERFSMATRLYDRSLAASNFAGSLSCDTDTDYSPRYS